MRIAVDAMGGDTGVSLTVPAALQALEQTPGLSLTLVGDEQQINSLLSGRAAAERCTVLHAATAISDQDSPHQVLRSHRQSSMFKAVELVQQGRASAMISAGNTGALLMIGRHLLKTISGIQKPAILATIPGATRQTYLLDVGANPDCSAHQLFEFAAMGAVLAESLLGRTVKVGLLNIGAEQHKGTAEVRLAAGLLEKCEALNYVGFVEANALFEGAADVVVCDGYVGNVIIKSSAGVANVVKTLLQDQLEHSLMTRLSGYSPTSMVNRLLSRINPQRFNGASLLGLQGCIVKSHGNATEEGFTCAIFQAVREAENQVPQLIAEKVAAIMAAC